MRIAMAQMKMDNSTEHNLNKTIAFMRGAMRKGADLIIFPELQLSPFFPKYSNQNVSSFLMTLQSPEIKTICETCRKMSIYASPNVYLEIDGKRYDASLLIDKNGEIIGISKMVHIAQAKNFYEQDYYSPSDDGFKVFNTSFEYLFLCEARRTTNIDSYSKSYIRKYRIIRMGNTSSGVSKHKLYRYV